MRFACLNPQDTLRIYDYPEKSLSSFRNKNRYGFSNYPDQNCRMIDIEIKGENDIKAEEEERKL
jgi:hypothetical protein